MSVDTMAGTGSNSRHRLNKILSDCRGPLTATVVGVLGRDDENGFQALVTEISDELQLDARVRLHGGSFSVRFTRRTDANAS